VFSHPLGGSFNTPPAGGAFPQPLPNLPGIPVDGGLFTVDVANHSLTSDVSNGFMFPSGPSRRYVASIKSNGVESFSSLPGGESGVPGNQFNVNLLPLWLTNESFPLINRIENTPALIIHINVFRPLLLGPLLGR
jgi:penicillin G amidase